MNLRTATPCWLDVFISRIMERGYRMPPLQLEMNPNDMMVIHALPVNKLKRGFVLKLMISLRLHNTHCAPVISSNIEDIDICKLFNSYFTVYKPCKR